MTPLRNKLAGEITLWGITLWEEIHFAEVSMRTPLGISMINFAGDRKNFAEDDPSMVIS